jgi:hypothetical protein
VSISHRVIDNHVDVFVKLFARMLGFSVSGPQMQRGESFSYGFSKA